MSIRLVYHSPQSVNGGVSPFEEAIVRVVKDSDVFIACPYFNLNYLEDIVSLSKSWYILTDVEEWLRSQNRVVREKIQQFIEKYSENIRHISGLHAKVIATSDKALIGSANFTDRGIKERHEMSVLIEHEPEIDELCDWFKCLWSQSSPISIAELSGFIRSMPAESIYKEYRHPGPITSNSPKIRSTLKVLGKNKHKLFSYAYEDDASKMLIERIKLAPNRDLIDAYLDLVKFVLESTGLESNDPRIVTSIPKSPNKYGFLPVTVNNRYVLILYKNKTDFSVVIIYGAEFETSPQLMSEVSNHLSFGRLPGENSADTPHLLWFSDVEKILSSDEIMDGWIRAVLAEKKRTIGSPYRKYHQPVVHKAAIDIDYRNLILDKSFL